MVYFFIKEVAEHCGLPLQKITQADLSLEVSTISMDETVSQRKKPDGSSTTLQALLQDKKERPDHALEATMSAYFEVMQATHDEKEYELQLVKAQDGMVRPRRWFDARQLEE